MGRVRPVVALTLIVLLAAGTAPMTAVAAELNNPPVAVDDPGEACNPDSFGGSYPIPEDPIEPLFLALSCAPLLNDSDPDGDVMVPEIVTAAAHGAASLEGSSADEFNFATYMPEDDFSTRPGNVPGGTWLSDAFTYRVTDGQAYSEPATYRLWVAPINDAPTFIPGPSVVEVAPDSGPYSAAWATDIAPGPNEDYQNVKFEVVDVDVTGVPNLFSAPPAIDDDGVLTFTPGSGEVGLAHITVRAVDDGGVDDWGVAHMLREQPDDTSEEVAFDIVVASHRPVAHDDPDLEAEWPCSPFGALMVVEDTRNPYLLAGSCGPLTNDTDPDGDVLTGEVVEPASHGTVTWETLESNGEPDAFILYMPDPDWSTPRGDGPRDTWASDSFTYRATDGELWSDPATYWIWVAPINDPPTFDFVEAVDVAQDSGAYAAPWATNIDPGPYEDGQTVSFEILGVETTTNPDLFSVPPAIDEAGVLTFTPATQESGAAVFQVRAQDDGGLEDWQVEHEFLSESPDDTSETVALTIVVGESPSNAAPEAVGDSATVPQDAGAISIDVLANDSDADAHVLTVVSVTQATHGSVAITGDGSAVTYDPAGLYAGADSFTYTVSDGHGGSATGTVTVAVAPDTTAPNVGTLAQSMPSQAIGISTVKVDLSWVGSDVGTGVASYQLERQIGGGAWSEVSLPTSTSISTTATLTIDTAYAFRVRATDRAGNVGPWSTFPILNPKSIQETSSQVAYTGPWTEVSDSSLSGGSARYASLTTRRAKVSFTGQEVALIATRRTTGGQAEIRVDGVVVGTVDLDASATQYRRLVFRKGFASTASHTLEVRPLGDGRVEIDAFIVLR